MAEKTFSGGISIVLVRVREDRSVDELDRRSRRAGTELTITSS